MQHDVIDRLNRELESATPQMILRRAIELYGNSIALASSLGAEDQVLTDILVKMNPAARVFTLDTGRLFPETYDLIDRTSRKYKIKIEIFFPDYKKVQEMVNLKGINLFHESIENRKECCLLRKIEPLQRAFAGCSAWICGLRTSQSVTRKTINHFEWDAVNQLVKVNPLSTWTAEQVWEYINLHKVPYNVLHDKNFPSIGCQPCTRAIMPGEDERAGRWWWENPETKECGLHKR